MNKDERELVFLILIIIISSAFFSLILIDIGGKGVNELSNNSTLIAEVGLGIIITLVVFRNTKLNERKMDEKISSVLNIVKESEKIQKKNKKQVYHSVFSSFKKIQDEIIFILNVSKSYKKSDSKNKKTCMEQIISSCNKIRRFSEETFDDPNKISLEFFDFDTIRMIKIISSLCKSKPEFNKDGKTANVAFCNNLKNMIEPEMIKLNKKIRDQVDSKQSQLEENIGKVSISVSSDRTIYPLNSTMHMRAKIGSIINNEEIIFEIFNSKRKLLLSQTIDPKKIDYSNLTKSNIFQACFQMKGKQWKEGESYIVRAVRSGLMGIMNRKQWKEGESYIVRATYDDSYSENMFTIDRRIPVIQSDKSVYRIGSDVILTVIDPDADKDNEIAEFVGDRNNSKVIIKSKYGKIDGYRLKETGDSTGIFQSIIGILGIRKNGSVIPQNFDGKIIDKIQGIGTDDGFIGGAPGDKITITYKNSSNIVSIPIYISDFGATIEMDQKKYAPTDKVHVTVAASDFNFDSKKIDVIGQERQDIICIRTSVDKLDGYKLVETGPDTGIFTGELQLIPIKDGSSKQSKSTGPTDGVINCNIEDFIEISFTSFEKDTVVSRSTIKS